MRNIDPALLRAFVVVADTTSMTVAANTLHLTQGAISQQIKRLEEMFDCVLFERDRRGLRLTRAGERLMGKAKRLLALNDELWAEMATPEFTGSVRLGVPHDLVGTRLPPVLRSFMQAFPKVEMSLICDSSPALTEAVSAGRVDLALIEQPVDRSGGECLDVERLVWVGCRGGSAHRKRPLPLSVVSESCAFRPVMFQALRQHGVEWRPLFENGNLDATKAAVRMDLAVTAWLPSTVPPDLERLPFDSGLPELPSFAITLHVARPDTQGATREMIRYLREGFLSRSRQAA